MKTKFITVLFITLFIATPARPAEPYLDELSNEINTEIVNTFENKIVLSDDGKISIGLYSFNDLTQKFPVEPQILRMLLFDKLSKNAGFETRTIDDMDGIFNSMFPLQTLDQLSQQQLMQLAETVDIDYVFSAKIISMDSSPVLQFFIYNVRKGVLLFTPMFPVKKPDPAPDTVIGPDMPPVATDTIDIPTATGTETVVDVQPPDSYEPPPFQNIPAEKLMFITGPVPQSPIVDFELMNIDPDRAPEIAFITSSAMNILKLKDGKATKFWKNKYKSEFAHRGLAGTFHHQDGDIPRIYVSLNSKRRIIEFIWEDATMMRTKGIDHYLVDMDPATGYGIMSDFGPGQVTFSGRNTLLIESVGSTRQVGFEIKDDYYAACIMSWSDTSTSLTFVGTVDEDGAIKVYLGSGNIVAQTPPVNGGALDCWQSPRTGARYLLTTTAKDTQDRAVLLRLEKDGKKFTLKKQWVSPPLEGAVPHLKFFDLDEDKMPEVIGVHEKPDGTNQIFYVAPRYAQEDY